MIRPAALDAVRTAVNGVSVGDGERLPCRSWSALDLTRPRSLNAERSGSHWSHRAATAEARERWAWLWRAAKVPALHRVVILAAPSYKNRPQDPGNCYPSVKAAVDALEDVGAIPKDTGDHVLAVIMLAPVKAPDGLTVTVLEVE